MVDVLDQNLIYFVDVVEKVFGIVCREIEGVGVVGGFGWSLLVFFYVDLKRGIDIVFEVVDFENEV